jgi:putative sterol carrier protein
MVEAGRDAEPSRQLRVDELGHREAGPRLPRQSVQPGEQDAEHCGSGRPFRPWQLPSDGFIGRASFPTTVAKFPSPEWAELIRAAVNERKDYAEAARGWEGDVLLRVLPQDPAAVAAGIHLDLAQGACRGATYVADARGEESEFAFEASAHDWQRVLRKDVDPVRAVLSGQIRVRGNFAKAMRFTKASTLLVDIAATIPTEF